MTERTHFLTEEKRQKLAVLLNAEIDFPILNTFIKEDGELRIFRKIVDATDKYASKYIPDEILEGMNSAEVQIEDAVARALKEYVVPMVSDLVPLPFLPRAIKDKILDFLVEFLVDTMAAATTLDERIEEFLSAG